MSKVRRRSLLRRKFTGGLLPVPQSITAPGTTMIRKLPENDEHQQKSKISRSGQFSSSCPNLFWSSTKIQPGPPTTRTAVYCTSFTPVLSNLFIGKMFPWNYNYCGYHKELNGISLYFFTLVLLFQPTNLTHSSPPCIQTTKMSCSSRETRAVTSWSGCCASGCKRRHTWKTIATLLIYAIFPWSNGKVLLTE